MSYCIYHGYFLSQECPGCVVWKSDALKILEARIADKDAELLDLRRRVSELEHLVRGARRADLVEPQP